MVSRVLGEVYAGTVSGEAGGIVLAHFICSPYRNWKETLNAGIVRSAGKSKFPQAGYPGLHVSSEHGGSLQRVSGGITFTFKVQWLTFHKMASLIKLTTFH